MTDFEALYYALNKLNEIKNTTNEWDISVIQSAIMTHIEQQTKKEEAEKEAAKEAAKMKQEEFDLAIANAKAILKEMDEIAEKGLRA